MAPRPLISLLAKTGGILAIDPDSVLAVLDLPTGGSVVYLKAAVATDFAVVASAATVMQAVNEAGAD